MCIDIKVILSAVLFCLFSVFSVQAGSPALQDLARHAPAAEHVQIFKAKKVITLDPNKPESEAIAISGDRIVGIGTLEDLKAEAGKNTHIVSHEFSDKIIVPGFIAQHIHPLLSSLTLTSHIISIEDWVLPDRTVPAVRDRDGYLSRLTKIEQSMSDPNELLLTWGYHHYFHDKVRRADLDKISTSRPIVVWHRSCHEFVFNTAALKLMKIDSDFLSKIPASAKNQTSLEEGHFWEQGLMALASRILPYLATPEKFKAGLEFTKAYLRANGITIASEPGGITSKKLQDMENATYGGDDTPFRFYFIPDGRPPIDNNKDTAGVLKALKKTLSWGKGKSQIVDGQVKLFIDGAVYSQLMQMTDGYTDGHHGEWMMDPPVFERAFQTYWDAGYQIHIHQNGDAGLEQILLNLEKAMTRNPRKDHRTTIVHFAFSTKEQVKRLADLGAIVSVNPYYVMALADKYSEAGIGPERAREMVRLGDLQRAGVRFSLHSDMPMAPENPLFLMHNAVNRTTFSGRVAAPQQRATRLNALKGVTYEAAYSLQLEKQVGSIEVGKIANLTILGDNPLTVEQSKIKDIEITGSIQEGRVYRNNRTKIQPAKEQKKTKNREKKSTVVTRRAMRMPVRDIRQFSMIYNRPPYNHDHSKCIASINRQLGLALTVHLTQQARHE